MIVKLIAPGIIPGDYVTVDLPGVPQRGDTVAIEVPDDQWGVFHEELLTVVGIRWPVTLSPDVRQPHHAVASLPEVTCGLTPDAALNPIANNFTINNCPTERN